MALFLQAIIDGLTNGAVYALIGIGMVMYYRSSRIINLAHGESFVAAGLTIVFVTRAGQPLVVALLLGVVVATLLALGLERFLIRSRLDWTPSMIVMLTLGVVFCLRGVWRIIGGTTPYSFAYVVDLPTLRLWQAVVHPQALFLIGLTVLIGAALVLFFRYAPLGKAMTASAENPMASQLLGIDVHRLRSWSFGLAGLLGGVAAALIVPLGFIDYSRGLDIVLQGFVAGAIASMLYPGRALVSGLTLGVVESMVATFGDPLYRTPLVFGVVLIVALIFLGRSVTFGGAARA